MSNFRPGDLVQGQPLGMTVLQTLLTADNQNVDPTYPNYVSMVQVGSDNTTAANRTFTLTPSTLVGHRLLLYFYTGSSTTAQLADSGTMKLTTVWEPLQYDVLELVSDGTNWNELCRGSSTGIVPALALASAHLFVGNGSNVATDVAVTGDVAIDNTGLTAISTGVIVNTDVNAAAAIAYSKLAALTSGNVLVGSAGNVATSVALTGDVTNDNAGVTAIGAGKVTVAMHAAAVVAETTGTITQAQLLAIGTPVALVSAPGAGKMVLVDEIEFFHSYSTAVYATGADLQVEYETTGTNIMLVDSGLVTAAASKTVVIRPSCYDLDASTGTSEGFDMTNHINKAVQVSGSNFTLGNASNVLKYRVRFHTVTAIT